jgi:hypothetical protein
MHACTLGVSTPSLLNSVLYCESTAFDSSHTCTVVRGHVLPRVKRNHLYRCTWLRPRLVSSTVSECYPLQTITNHTSSWLYRLRRQPVTVCRRGEFPLLFRLPGKVSAKQQNTRADA